MDDVSVLCFCEWRLFFAATSIVSFSFCNWRLPFAATSIVSSASCIFFSILSIWVVFLLPPPLLLLLICYFLFFSFLFLEYFHSSFFFVKMERLEEKRSPSASLFIKGETDAEMTLFIILFLFDFFQFDFYLTMWTSDITLRLIIEEKRIIGEDNDKAHDGERRIRAICSQNHMPL